MTGVLFAYVYASLFVGGDSSSNDRCERLIVTEGRDTSAQQLCLRYYNSTKILENGTRSSLSSGLNRWASFVDQPNLCHVQLPLFICASFFPVCDPDTGAGMYPCAQFCTQMENACRNVFIAADFVWPAQFNCSNREKYLGPENASHCLSLPAEPVTPSIPIPVTTPVNSSLGKIRPCHGDYYFQEQNRTFVTWWIAIWSVLCLVSSLVTVATFFMDRERFNYPEKPIVFLSLSYSVFSLTFIIRLIVGDSDIVCSGDHLVDTGVNSGPCTIIALLIYFMWMSSYSWWLVLTLTWLLAAGKKWGTEAIAKHSTHFHIFAWGTPAVKTLILVATEHVDADELSRVCSVGNFNDNALLGFILVPISVYLLIGTVFIIVGIVSLIRIRSLMKSGGKSTQKLEQLIVRIGILSVFYTGPASVVLGIYAYEYADRTHWLSYCTDPSCKPACIGSGCGRPVFAVFTVKYFMLLVVGVTSSVWIWSGKTVASWKRFVRRLRKKSKRVDIQSRQAGNLTMEGSYKRTPVKNGLNGSVVHVSHKAASIGRGSVAAQTHSITQV